MKVPLSEVPMKLQRRAVRHLESLRGLQLPGPAAPDSELGPTAWPIFRPDIDDVAYWELTLVHPGEDRRRGASDERSGADAAGGGFIVVSTGDHDFPVPHWSAERPPPSRQLEEEAQRRGKTISRIYRLDALAYLAEDEAGNEVARSGQVPVLPEGLDAASAAPEISSFVARPRDKRGDDQVGKDDAFDVEEKGPQKGPVGLVDPQEWRRLKERYAERFGPMLADVRRNAARAWKIDRDVEEFGEGIVAGDAFSVRLLRRDATVEVTGEGKAEVAVELDDKRRGPPLIRGRSARRSHKQERDFEVRVKYSTGESETLRYFLVSPDTPSNAQGNRPDERGKPA